MISNDAWPFARRLPPPRRPPPGPEAPLAGRRVALGATLTRAVTGVRALEAAGAAAVGVLPSGAPAAAAAVLESGEADVALVADPEGVVRCAADAGLPAFRASRGALDVTGVRGGGAEPTNTLAWVATDLGTLLQFACVVLEMDLRFGARPPAELVHLALAEDDDAPVRAVLAAGADNGVPVHEIDELPGADDALDGLLEDGKLLVMPSGGPANRVAARAGLPLVSVPVGPRACVSLLGQRGADASVLLAGMGYAGPSARHLAEHKAAAPATPPPHDVLEEQQAGGIPGAALHILSR